MRESVVYQRILQEGIERGIEQSREQSKQLLLGLLQRRLGTIDEAAQIRLSTLSFEQMQSLA